MSTPGATELLAPPAAGRIFTAHRRVRLADTDAHGNLQLDALYRYAQDIAADDANDAMPASDIAWVVRKTLVDVASHPQADDELEIATWCSGYGGRWAERRTSLRGQTSGRVEVVTVWVAVDTRTGALARLDAAFVDAYGVAADGRRVSASLRHPDAPADAERRPWSFRATDIDRLGHVNNAAYWAVAEELLEDRPDSLRAELEFREPLPVSVPLELLVSRPDLRTCGAWLCEDGVTKASLRLDSRG